MSVDRLIGLGCMRLSTSPERDDKAAIAVIHTALDAGIRLLDSADSYCLEESDRGHNERLIAEALRTWSGDSTGVTVATKGGLRRPAGRWVPDGRASHLRQACEESCRALAVDCIDLYQLHAVDPRTRFETSVRALASLQQDGRVSRVGLCNVTVAQIETARSILDVSAVQVSAGVLDDTNFRNGVAEYCREYGIRFLAYRPLGGNRSARLAREAVLVELAAEHGATPHEIALAWLLDLDPAVVPIPGATRVETALSIGRARSIRLTTGDHDRLDARFPAGRLLRVSRSERRPADSAEGEVVLIMGLPGAGKSRLAGEFVERGYSRLNRDDRGGTLSGLVRSLDEGLAGGRTHWVLDNTYPARSARNEVIECAWRHGVPVRCIHVDTPLADAQVNAITRMIEVHGHLPSPGELRDRSKADPRFFGPDAQFRYQRQFEPPAREEGFTAVDERSFQRLARNARNRAVILEYDEVICGVAPGASVTLNPLDVRLPDDRRDRLRAWAQDGWLLFTMAWRPQLPTGETVEASIRACFNRTRQILGVDIDSAFCPHAAGPPVCWCRKPLPGLVIDFALRRGVALEDSILVGRSPADRTLADRLGLTYFDHNDWFNRPPD